VEGYAGQGAVCIQGQICATGHVGLAV